MCTDTNNHVGYVYVIYCGGKYKIGRTKNIKRRQRDLQTGSSEELQLLYYRKYNNYIQAEKTIHSILASYRVQGEWFLLDDIGKELLDKIFGAVQITEQERQRLERMGLFNV